MGIITLTIASFFNYNLKTFSKSADSMNEQANLRLLSLKITNQLRNIGYIDLGDLTEIPAVVTTDSFILIDDNRVRKGDASGVFDLADEVINDIAFSLRKSEDENKYFLGVKVTGKVHSYTTEVLLNNIITDNVVQMDNTDIGKSGCRSLRFNYNKPPVEFYSSPTVPVEDESNLLRLIPPDPLTVKIGKTFSYIAKAEGGVPPYAYKIEYVSFDDNEPIVINDTIRWNAPSIENKKMTFRVDVTDNSNAEVGTISVLFTITARK
jgi:hypothetical protein